MSEQGVLTDKSVWENYYKGKSTLRSVNTFINRNVFDAEIIDVMFKHMDSSDRKSLVEMGCGGSEWLPYINDRFDVSINGIDYLENGCRISRELLTAHGIQDANIYCADFFEFHKEKDLKFDYLVSFGVIEHFDPPSRPIGAFRNYIVDNGIIVTTCPNTGGWAMKMQKWFDKQVYDNHMKFRLADLVRYHQENGYEIIDASYTGFLSFNNLVFSNFSLLGRVAKIGLKLANAPFVYFFYLLKKYLRINFSSGALSSNMIVVARKK